MMHIHHTLFLGIHYGVLTRVFSHETTFAIKMWVTSSPQEIVPLRVPPSQPLVISDLISVPSEYYAGTRNCTDVNFGDWLLSLSLMFWRVLRG